MPRNTRYCRYRAGFLIAALGLLAACERERTGTALPVAHAQTPPTPTSGRHAPAPTAGPPILGAAPLCEPSAAVALDDAHILVADNELQDALYHFRLTDTGPVEQRRVEMPAKKRPRDIEALTWLDDARRALLVVGSHSRSWDCEPRPKRHRMRVLGWDGERLNHQGIIDTGDTWPRIISSAESCRSTLLAERSPAADALCDTLVAGEARATEGKPESCEVLNIEGAVRIDGRVWLGLRSPLVEGRAPMLRLTPELDALRFDAVQLLDLQGQGIRELALHDGLLHIISGPPLDAEQPFQLWTLPASDLASAPTQRLELPTSSESLAFGSAGIFAIIDGGEGDDESVCDEPARYVGPLTFTP